MQCQGLHIKYIVKPWQNYRLQNYFTPHPKDVFCISNDVKITYIMLNGYIQATPALA